MRPGVWRPPVELSAAEAEIVRRVQRARLFVFLRQHRHELFDEAFEGELAAMYADRPKGRPPVPPAQLETCGLRSSASQTRGCAVQVVLFRLARAGSSSEAA